MAKCTNLATPMVRWGAGFHANQTRRYLREELENLSPAELAPNNSVALRINGVDLKYVLGQIKADNDNLLTHGTTPLDVASDSRILHTYLGAGAVHPIMSETAIDQAILVL